MTVLAVWLAIGIIVWFGGSILPTAAGLILMFAGWRLDLWLIDRDQQGHGDD